MEVPIQHMNSAMTSTRKLLIPFGDAPLSEMESPRMKSLSLNLIRTAAVVAGLLGSAGLATAQTVSMLDFNDLGPSPVGTHMLDGYGGFKWTSSSWHYMSSAAEPGNTYLALSGTATSIYREGGADFYFQGADFWSRRGLDANGTFYYVLSHDGALVYDGRNDPDGRNRFDGVPTTFRPNYAGPVDTVAVVFAQGGDDWDHLAMDNVRFAESTSVVVPPAPQPPSQPPPPPPPAPVQTTYKLAVKTKGKGSVAVSRTGTTFVANTVLTLTATPAAGATWVGWSGDVSSSARSIVITMNRPLTIQANFK